MSTHHTDIICMKVVNEKKELTETYLSAKPDIYSNQLDLFFIFFMRQFPRNNVHIVCIRLYIAFVHKLWIIYYKKTTNLHHQIGRIMLRDCSNFHI